MSQRKRRTEPAHVEFVWSHSNQMISQKLASNANTEYARIVQVTGDFNFSTASCNLILIIIEFFNSKMDSAEDLVRVHFWIIFPMY